MLNVHRLAVLSAVVTEGSITAAAATLQYTPSAVSQHIAALERETGSALLERIGRRVRPTPAGTLLAHYAAQILTTVHEAEDALAALMQGRAGRLRVATFGSAGTGLVPPAVAQFRVGHPGVDVSLSLAEQPEALAALRADRADLAVVILDLARDGHDPPSMLADQALRWEPLVADPYFVALPADHALADRREIALEDLARERMVSGDRNRACPCSEAFNGICAALGFQPSYAIEVDDYPTVQSLVAAGLGCAAIPLLGLSPAVHDGIVVRPLVRPSITRRIYAVSSAGRSDPLSAAMVACLREAADTLPIPQSVPMRDARAPAEPIAITL